jgi:putative membrane protein
MRRLSFSLIVLLIVMVTACRKTESYNNETAATASSSTETNSTAATGASGQTGTAGTSGMTGTAGATLNDKDKDFVSAAERGGKAEVDVAQDATAHAENTDVKAFAQKLVDDHTKANAELEQFGLSHGVTTTAEIEAKAKEAKERLAKLTGKNFDQAFIRQMVDDHQATIKTFEDESKNGTDSDLKAWVDKTLPTLRDHLKMAENLQSKLGKK